MTNTVISVEHLTKQYDLGVIGTGTLSRDLNRWWARVRHQPDPYTRIGQQDAFARIGESILALDDVSFTVQQGEALGIIGRNGAGKSTLLKILSRVTAPTSGVVKVKGRIGSLLEVGTGFHPELTGRENVYLNGAILGMKKVEVTRKFDEIVDFAGVEKFIDTPVKRYSSGMYVRLAFAVAAHLESEILIVDEVLAVGDAEFQKKCLGKMGDVASKEGRTVLFVSHNLGAVQTLCSSAILMSDGKNEIIDKSENVILKYLNHATGSRVKICDRVDRDGNGQLKFIDVHLSSSLIGPEQTDFPIGSDLFVRMTIETTKPEYFWVDIIINDASGNRVLESSNRLHGLAPFYIEEKDSFLFYMPNCRLGEGSYSISLTSTITKSLEIADFINDAISFTIYPSDIYNSGFQITKRFGNTHLPNEWLTKNGYPFK